MLSSQLKDDHALPPGPGGLLLALLLSLCETRTIIFVCVSHWQEKLWFLGHTFTDVVLLEQLIEAGQVLHNELSQDTLVSLHTHQGGAEVGGRNQFLDDSTHHPEGIFLLQEEQQRGSHLGF